MSAYLCDDEHIKQIAAFACSGSRSDLEHIARWLKTAELANKTTQLPPDAVRLSSPGEPREGGRGRRWR